ncbi:acyl-CoA dehydrogenase (plasmid) [Rhodococcus sp. BH4]|uniref:acyl-CoA dehydrogenase n=1 Tax=Rhodococcus sp. BH4 TaxID=1807790 RepID=UPI0009C38E10|nr:acyl-CoA dehydrogenase [Rhodococcus sp. BH4]ARE37835.1 acyl-CoA dehydrogenase [Rhodococcus sp. BH4]
MPLALTDDHLAIAEVVRSFLSEHKARTLTRSVLDHPDTDISELWRQMAGLGWLGLHLPEQFGGDDYGLPELAIVAEELGRIPAAVPFISTVVTSAAIAAHGTPELQNQWLPKLIDGTSIAGVSLSATATLDASGRLTGIGGPAVGAAGAQLIAVRIGADVALVRSDASGVVTADIAALDPTLEVRAVTFDAVVPEALLEGAAAEFVRSSRALGAAEAAGGARACMEMAVEYSKVREQFGRAIGSFQAVKHHAANMLVSAELAVATAWDAARDDADAAQAELAAQTAAVVAFDSYVTNAEMNLQIHGGIGFTWEHDCHLFMRRAQSLRAFFADSDTARDGLFAAAQTGARRNYSVDLPVEADAFRTTARQFVADYSATAEADRRAFLVDSGYMVPHWRTPFGLAAGPVQQLVIDEEFGSVDVPNLGIGGWVLLTITEHGSEEQVERWIRPSLMGDLVWCQLFSEPGAGSDAAAVSTRGIRVDGGWRVTGQKVWTSNAQNCNRGLATIRTNRDAPKHKGITAMVIDMAAPGVTVRPLREISGDAVFNEIFFDDVFVPDADVVGAVDNGWTVARATMGNERISIGGMNSGRSAFDLVDLAMTFAPSDGAAVRSVAELLATEQAIRVLNLRHVVRAVSGAGPGPEGSVTKLLSAEHSQHVSELGMRIGKVATVTGIVPEVAYDYLFGRALTIAGGTSEINRNVIAERLLGLPREQIAR